MDPLSMTASIGTLCGATVKIISTLSEFIDAVRQGPSEVQSLNNELASLYSSLGHVKIAVQAPRASQIPEKWTDDFKKLTKDCGDTLKDVQIIVDKARVEETDGSAKQIWKTVRFVFKDKQIQVLKRRIVSQNGILQILLSALSETRSAYIEKQLGEIHEKVNELVKTRANVKEVLVVLEKEEEGAELAQYTLTDRTSRNFSRVTEALC